MATGIGPEFITSPLPEIRAGKTGTAETLSVAGAISILTEPTQLTITGTPDITFTLAAGAEGQKKLIYLTSKGGAGNALVTGNFSSTSTTLTLDTATEWAELRCMGGEWYLTAGTATLS